MNLILKICASFFIVTCCCNALALTLQEAKQKGYVVETKNGYLTASGSSAPKEAKDLIAKVNKARKQLYKKIADDRKIQLSTVEERAGKKNTTK